MIRRFQVQIEIITCFKGEELLCATCTPLVHSSFLYERSVEPKGSVAYDNK